MSILSCLIAGWNLSDDYPGFMGACKPGLGHSQRVFLLHLRGIKLVPDPPSAGPPSEYKSSLEYLADMDYEIIILSDKQTTNY